MLTYMGHHKQGTLTFQCHYNPVIHVVFRSLFYSSTTWLPATANVLPNNPRIAFKQKICFNILKQLPNNKKAIQLSHE